MPRSLPLSVILVTHNQSSLLQLQLASLERQINIDTSNFEVIVTDDSSESSEIARIEKIIGETSLACRLVRQQSERFWATRARNNGIRIAKGKTLIFFDGDMIPELNVLSKHLSLHSARKKQIVAGHRLRRTIRLENSNNLPNLDDILMACRANSSPDLVMARRQHDEERRRNEFLQSKHSWRVVFSCHMSIQRAPEVLFDEKFIGWGPEDWEVAYRLTQHHGYSAYFAPDIVAYEIDNLGHGVGNVFRTQIASDIIDYLRNVFRFFDSCPGLEIEDAFWSLRRLELRGDHWNVVPADLNCDLEKRVTFTRAWLLGHNYYDRGEI